MSSCSRTQFPSVCFSDAHILCAYVSLKTYTHFRIRLSVTSELLEGTRKVCLPLSKFDGGSRPYTPQFQCLCVRETNDRPRTGVGNELPAAAHRTTRTVREPSAGHAICIVARRPSSGNRPQTDPSARRLVCRLHAVDTHEHVSPRLELWRFCVTCKVVKVHCYLFVMF